MLKAIFKENKWFFLPYLILLTLSLIHLYQYEKGYLEKTIDLCATPLLDRFFVFYTHVGDGIFASAVVLLFLFLNRKQFFTLAIGMISTGVISQLLKRSIGKEAWRPARYFEGDYLFRNIDFLERHMNHSMPSGHTTAAFCLFLMLALFSAKKTYGYLFLLIAAAAGFSRIYLAQHFLEDVIVGSLLGISIGLTSYLLGQKWFQSDKMNQPLIHFK